MYKAILRTTWDTSFNEKKGRLVKGYTIAVSSNRYWSGHMKREGKVVPWTKDNSFPFSRARYYKYGWETLDRFTFQGEIEKRILMKWNEHSYSYYKNNFLVYE